VADADLVTGRERHVLNAGQGEAVSLDIGIIGEKTGNQDQRINRIADVSGAVIVAHRRIVDAADDRADFVGGAVLRRNDNRVGQRLPGAQLLDGKLGGVGGIGPVACCVDCQCAKGSGNGAGNETRLAAIDVGYRQRAAIGDVHVWWRGGFERVFRQDDRLRVVLENVRLGVSADNRGIVGAGDGEADVVGGAIRCLDGDDIVQRGASGQGLYCRVGVVERVGPVAGCVENERAVRTSHRTIRKARFAGIHIGNRQCARGDLKRTAVFGHATGVNSADHGCIIGAVDDNRDVVVWCHQSPER
jgi:hypothetical protein